MKHHYGKGIKQRAVDKKSTYYLAPHGAKDPIGRMLTQIEIETILEWVADPTVLGTAVTGLYLQHKDKFPSLNGYSVSFLRDIQHWHDNDAHWDEKGVSEEGWKALQEIRNKVLEKVNK